MMNRSSGNIKLRLKKLALAFGALFGWAFASTSPPQAFSAQTESLTVTIRPLDIYPPAAVTDLTASPGAIGQMLLQWTAPDSDNNLFPTRSAAANYTIRIATFSVDTMGSTTTWWNNAQDVLGEPAPSAPGQTDSALLNSLLTDVTWYAAIKSVDAIGNISSIDIHALTPNQQAAAFLLGSTIPSTPTGFNGVALSTTSVFWNWNTVFTATFYRLNQYPSGTLVVQTTDTFVNEGGFSPNTGLSRTVSAGNGNGLSSPTAPLTVYTLAATPTNLFVSSVTFSTVSLVWNANGNTSGTQYRLDRSPDGLSYSGVALTTQTTHTDTNLTQLTTYYYRVVAFNGDGIPSAPSAAVSTMTIAQVDFTPPASPKGLKGSLDPSGQAFTLIWEDAVQNADGTPITDLVGYNIYRRITLTGTPVKITPNPITISAFADVVNGQTFYYTVRAIDTSDNESEDSLIADSSSEMNIIFLGPDGQSSVFMPETVNDLLRSNFNPYGVPLTIRLTEEPIASNSAIVRHIRLSLVRGDNNQELSDLAFGKPQSVVSVGYNDVSGQVLPGEPGQQTDLSQALGTPDQLSLYWFNGVTWVKVGGTLDLLNQSLKTKSSFLGNFQLRVSAAATSLTLSQGNVYPRVFTPNDDGYNDRVYFILENPKNSSVQGEILDISGRHVANLPPPAANTGIGTTLTWDGKDDTGSVVPSGAYMYKITGEGKTFTGTVAVAR